MFVPRGIDVSFTWKFDPRKIIKTVGPTCEVHTKIIKYLFRLRHHSAPMNQFSCVYCSLRLEIRRNFSARTTFFFPFAFGRNNIFFLEGTGRQGALAISL